MSKDEAEGECCLGEGVLADFGDCMGVGDCLVLGLVWFCQFYFTVD